MEPVMFSDHPGASIYREFDAEPFDHLVDSIMLTVQDRVNDVRRVVRGPLPWMNPWL